MRTPISGCPTADSNVVITALNGLEDLILTRSVSNLESSTGDTILSVIISIQHTLMSFIIRISKLPIGNNVTEW